MTDAKRDAESVSDEIERLEREAKEMRLQQETVQVQITTLRGQEDAATGTSHAQEIFRLSQEKLRLAAEIDYRTAKANRLRLGGGGDPLQ